VIIYNQKLDSFLIAGCIYFESHSNSTLLYKIQCTVYGCHWV